MSHVIVFERTYDVFGPFPDAEAARDHLKESGFSPISENYWAAGTGYAHIREEQSPRTPQSIVQSTLAYFETH